MTPPPTPEPHRHYVMGTRLRDEVRVYLRYVLALANPGVRVPIFGRPRQAERSVTSKNPEEQILLLDEARSQLAGQANAMQNNQTRAATLLTVTVAELVYLVTVASNILKRGEPALVSVWGFALALAFMALAGAVAVLTTRAEYGGVNLTQVIDSDQAVLAELATRYAESLGIGALTNATRLTVLRDAVWLAVMAGLALVLTVPFSSDKSEDQSCKVPAGFVCVRPGPQPTMSAGSPALPTVSPSVSIPPSPLPSRTRQPVTPTATTPAVAPRP